MDLVSSAIAASQFRYVRCRVGQLPEDNQFSCGVGCWCRERVLVSCFVVIDIVVVVVVIDVVVSVVQFL